MAAISDQTNNFLCMFCVYIHIYLYIYQYELSMSKINKCIENVFTNRAETSLCNNNK